MLNHHKLQEYQLTEIPDRHKLDAKISLQDVSIGVQHLYPMSVVSPSYCANFTYHLCHIETRLLLAACSLTLGMTNLW